MSNLTLFGKVYLIPTKYALVIMAVLIILALAYLYCGGVGLWMIGAKFLGSGWYTLVPVILLSVELTVNGTRYVFFPEHILIKIITRLIMTCSVVYFFVN